MNKVMSFLVFWLTIGSLAGYAIGDSLRSAAAGATIAVVAVLIIGVLVSPRGGPS